MIVNLSSIIFFFNQFLLPSYIKFSVFRLKINTKQKLKGKFLAKVDKSSKRDKNKGCQFLSTINIT